jgi:hypothetical protein
MDIFMHGMGHTGAMRNSFILRNTIGIAKSINVSMFVTYYAVMGYRLAEICVETVKAVP